MAKLLDILKSGDVDGILTDEGYTPSADHDVEIKNHNHASLYEPRNTNIQSAVIQVDEGRITNFTRENMPDPVDFGVGPIWIDGIEYWSDGVTFGKSKILPSRKGYILLGDSILANGCQYTGIVSLTAVGTLITCTLSSDGLIHKGMPISIGRVIESEYNGFFIVKERVSSTVFTYEAATAPIMSPATFDGQGTFYAVSKLKDLNIAEMANMLSLQKLKYLGSHAIGGAKISEIAAMVQNAFISSQNMYGVVPNMIFLCCGINDILSSRTYEQIKTDYIALIAEIERFSNEIIVIPLLPVDNSVSSGLISRVNFWLRNYLEGRKGLFVANSDRVVTSPSSASGNYKPNYSTDGIHPSNTGCYYIAKDINENYLSKLVNHSNLQSSSLKSTYSDDVDSPQLFDNPTMQGSTGVTAGTGVSGTIPDYIKVRGSGGGSQVIVCSIPLSGNGVGNDLQMVLTAAASGDSCHVLIDNPNDIKDRCAVGDTIYCAMTIEVTVDSGDFRGIDLRLQHTVGGFTGQDTAIETSGTFLNLDVPTLTYRLQTPIYTFQGDETFLSVIALFTFNSAGSAIIKVTDVDIINLSKI